jgi:hypothetical protein
MSKICKINQPIGLGDILFCQKIAHRAINEFGCEKVLWPVSNVYNYIGDYIINHGVDFSVGSINLGEQIINEDDVLYIPLETSDRQTSVDNPRAHGHIKYKFFYDTDWSDWKNYFEIKRNFEREKNLMEKLSVDINNPYNFINPHFGTPPQNLTNKNIKPKNDYRNIYMDIIPDVNIFDWIGIIENAAEIHTMETSLYYILEKLGIDKNVFIYSKYKFQLGQNDDYSYMKPHCSPKWNYV